MQSILLASAACCNRATRTDAMHIEVDIHKTLRSNGRVFTLDVKFACDDDLGVVFGSSGAGKALTLRAIAGLEKPDYGRIVVGGKVLFDSMAGIDVRPMRGRRLPVQDYALFPHLNVEEKHRVRREAVVGAQLSANAARRVAGILDLSNCVD